MRSAMWGCLCASLLFGCAAGAWDTHPYGDGWRELEYFGDLGSVSPFISVARDCRQTRTDSEFLVLKLVRKRSRYDLVSFWIVPAAAVQGERFAPGDSVLANVRDCNAPIVRLARTGAAAQR